MVKTYILDTAFLRNEDIFVYFYNQLSLKGKTLVDELNNEKLILK